jgi:hypothetical protein
MNSWCSRCALLTSATVGWRWRPAGDLAGVVHAQLDHRGGGARPQAQQRQRHADVVVEVALRGQAASPCQARRMDAIICVTVVLPLLPVTPISGRLNWAPAGGQRAQRRQAVGHLDAGQPGSFASDAMPPPGGHGARCAGVRQEGIGVKALALERDEQVARLQRAGVGVHARHGVAHRPPGAPGERWRESPGLLQVIMPMRWPPGRRSAPAPAAMSIETGAHRHLLVVLVALAGNQHHVGRAASPSARAMAAARSGSAPHGFAGDRARRIWCRMATGLRCAGCRWSPPPGRHALAPRAHQRALAGIAVAAAAEHAPQLATALRASGRSACSLVQRVGRVGIVHRHQRLAGQRSAPCGPARVAGRRRPHGIRQRHAQARSVRQHAQQVGTL